MRQSSKEQTVLHCQHMTCANDMQEAIAWSASELQPELSLPTGVTDDQHKRIPRKTFH